MTESTMGVDAVTHRARIGCFNARARRAGPRQGGDCHPTLLKDDRRVKFFARKFVCLALALLFVGAACCLQGCHVADCARQLLATMLDYNICYVFAPHVIVPNSTGYVYDMSPLLLLGMDVEEDPGPVEREDLMEMVRMIREELEDSRKKLAQEMRNEIATMRKEMHDMVGKVLEVEKRIAEVGDKIDTVTETITSIEDRQDGIEFMMEEMNERIEQQERRSRRDNILLHGVEESAGNERHEESVQRVLETVNQVLEEPLHENDIVRAHRSGKRVTGKARPLIACVARSADKLAILQKRAELRERNIGVSCDLTARQREEINQARQEGYFAFYKGGVLHREMRGQSRHPRQPSRPPGGNRPLTRSASRAGYGSTS